VKIFILNNERMGMVRQWQDITYGGRHTESYSESLPDFVKLAEAYGWTGIRTENMDQLDDGIAAMLATDGPVIVDCVVSKVANCFPMIASGAAHTEMILHANEISGEMDDEAKALV
jgi:acetolactate synthase-1/2/3 large subunit